MSEYSAEASYNESTKMEPEVNRREVMSFELKRFEYEVGGRCSIKDLERIYSFSSNLFTSRKVSWKGKKVLKQSSFDSEEVANHQLTLKMKSAMEEKG